MAYYLSGAFDVSLRLSFAAGNPLYIADADLIREVKHDRRLRNNVVHFVAFVSGVGVIVATRALFHV